MTQFGSDLILARLQTLHPKSIDLSLGRLERLLARLGHPERRVPPVVHIAGTNGKGSTLAMLDAMLVAAGQTVHRYISPHLVHFNERILLHGAPIEEALLASVLDECEQANAGDPITFFEITTAAAFLAFARTPADWLLLETGLGGRLDATNVVDRPALTLISPISMDHEAYLGTTLAAIAGEKAGIIKPGVKVLAGPQQPPALAVLDARAAALKAPLEACGREWRIGRDGPGFSIETTTGTLALPRPGLDGAHQIQNAALAAMAGRTLGLPDAALRRGVVEARWAARLQRLPASGFPALAGADVEVWLDGGHNPAAGEALAASLPAIARGRPIDLVVGMLETKDTAAFLAPMQGLIRRLHAVPVPGEQSGRPAAEIAATARGLGVEAAARADVDDALAASRALTDAAADGPGLVLICGSLYLAGDVLRRFA
jgi:dihydrofolate synthase/folylpolyglutamate synthase